MIALKKGLRVIALRPLEPRPPARRLPATSLASITPRRIFSASPLACDKPLPPRRKLPESEIEEAFLKGSGPGGQKINKTSSAVQLKHLPTGLVVKCQHTRSRDMNRKFARQILAEKLDEMEKGEGSRAAIKAQRASKKKASSSKKSHRKYRKLAEDKASDAVERGEQGDGEHGIEISESVHAGTGSDASHRSGQVK